LIRHDPDPDHLFKITLKLMQLQFICHTWMSVAPICIGMVSEFKVRLGRLELSIFGACINDVY